MALWIEVRCDRHLPGCYSDKNHGPMSLAGNSRVSLLHHAKRLGEDAVKEGWKRCVGGLICPSCRMEGKGRKP
jgi:hypothetical protein